MYNRYVPKDDGTWQKRSVQDSSSRQEPPTQSACSSSRSSVCNKNTGSSPSAQCAREPDVGRFLRRLIPENFDTGDLIIVLLLLLIAGDSQENRNTALLTLALYFFL